MIGLTPQKQQLIVLSAKRESRLKEYIGQVKDFIYDPSSQPLSLEDIAYTLQVGREPMDQRLAFIVESIEELGEKILRYSNGEEEISNLYKTSINKDIDRQESLISAKEGKEFVRILIENRRLDKIAQLWVDGMNIDFKLLHKGHMRQRVPLPTYPFESKRYWLDSKEKTANTRETDVLGNIANQAKGSKALKLKLNKKYDNIEASNLTLKNNNIGIKSNIKGDETAIKPRQRGIVMDSYINDNGTDNSNEHIQNNNKLNKAHIEKELRKLLSAVLYVDDHEIDENKIFLDLGLDSILTIEMVKKINELFNINIKSNDIYSYATLKKLAVKLNDIISPKAQKVSNNRSDGFKSQLQLNRTKKPLESSNDKIWAGDMSTSETSKIVLKNSGDALLGSKYNHDLRFDIKNEQHNNIEQVLDIIRTKTKKILTEVLYIEKNDLDFNRTFLDLGLDSILAIEMVKKLNEEFSINIKTHALYSHPTINKLTDHLSSICHVEKDYVQSTQSEEIDHIEKLRTTEEIPVIAQQSVEIEPSEAYNHKDEKVSKDIAVIGISGQFAGAKNVNELWNNLINGINSIKEIPRERWEVEKYYDPDLETVNTTYNKWGGFLEDGDKFDPSFFNISPLEADIMDPQQRLFLEEAWKAIEDAGYSDREMDNRRCGVFVGITGNDYLNHILQSGIELPPHAITANAPSILASRIAYYLNLRGASFSIDAACSSSFMAIDMACERLLNGTIDMALVGGANILSTPYAHIVLSKANMLSKTSQCKSFDEKGDGFVLGEAVGAVLLKPLDSALRDNDHIYGVIKASGVNQNGRSNGIVAPNAIAQEELIREIYERAGIDSGSISYIEAHGVGSKLGDAIEILALEEVYKETAPENNYCTIGSIKTNVGHTLAASGIVSLIKVLMSMKHKKIPGVLSFKEPNTDIDFDNSPFHVNIYNKPWRTNNRSPRRAAINSFGINGTNSHIVVEEAPISQINKSYESKPYHLVQLSAKTEKALKRKLDDLGEWLKNNGDNYSIGDIAYTLVRGRSFFNVRCAFVVKNVYDLTLKVKKLCKDSLRSYELMGNIAENSLDKEKEINSNNKELINEIISQSFTQKEYYNVLNRLAGLFIQGYDIEWDKLYSRKIYNRIPLPSYPFERESYWIKKSMRIRENEGKKLIDFLRLHPFIDVNESTIKEQHYRKVFRGEEFFLRDHKAGETRILPGVAYLEMARAAGALARPEDRIKSIKDVIWSRTLVVEDDLDTHISLYDDDDLVKFEIYTLGKEEERICHAQGTLLYEKTKERQPSNRETIDIDEIKQNAIEKKDRDEVSKLTQTSGMNFGPTFTVIQELYRCEDKSLTYFELPKEVEESFEEFILHPSLVDAAIQTTIGLKSDTELLNDPPELPFMLGELEIIRPLTKKCYAISQLSGEKDSKASRANSIDIKITDELGRVLIKMKNYFGRPYKTVSQHHNNLDYEDEATDEKNKAVANNQAMKFQSEEVKPKDSLKKRIEQYLKEILTNVSKIPAHKIQSKERLEKYGIDSLMIIELNKEMEKHFGNISKTLFFECQTLDQLSQYFIDNHTKIIKDKFESFNYNNRQIAITENVEARKDILGKYDPSFRSKYNNKQIENRNNDDIAIIGLSGKYPLAEDVDEFWDNLKEGRDCITEVPIERWDHRLYYDPDPDKAREGKSYCKWGGFINDADKFDPLFFRISPAEAENMDPQERLLLQTAWETLEDAGYTRHELKRMAKKDEGSDVGVFIGSTSNTYLLFGAEEWAKGNFITPGTYPWSLANRISYLFNFNGPSFCLDTGCSSALIAIHLACESLRKGECQYAVAGGVNLYLHHSKYNRLSLWRMLSPTGKCHTFGEEADGFVPGEGAGTILLKPLSRAIEDRDNIYGVIKASALNHDGRTNGYTVPSPNAQADVIVQCLESTNINPKALSYIEAHGTGTLLGDPIEITGLTKAFRKYTSDIGFCSIGSSKSNIGHLEGAAGIGGLTKILLQMKHKQLAPSLHAKRLNQNIDFANSPFYVQNELAKWNPPIIEEDGVKKAYPRLAGVSSFGAGGANAHIILEEYNEVLKDKYQNITPPYIIPLSARREEGLKDYGKKLLSFLEKLKNKGEGNTLLQSQEELNIANVAYTLQVGREPMEYRAATVVSSLEELIERIKEFCEGNKEGFYWGNIDIKSSSYDLLIDGEEGANFIKNIVDNRKLHKIAKLWVSGIDIDWNLLYGEKQPRRISLPTYPFAKESYWVKITEEVSGLHKGSNKVDELHPMISKNTSVFSEQRFTTILTGEEFYLTDHIINGDKMLPGVAYIEIARAAGEIAAEVKVKKLSDIVWMTPIVVDKGPQEIHISLYSEMDSGGYEIYTIDEEGKRFIHSQGKLVYDIEKNMDESDLPYIDIQSIKHRCTQLVDVSQHYRKFKDIGLMYGKSFRTLKEMYRNENEIISCIELVGEERVNINEFTLDPALMDGSLHCILELIDYGKESNLFLPFSMGEVEIFSSIPNSIYSYVRASVNVHDNISKIKKFDVTIMDEEGNVCVEIKDFSLMLLDKNLNEKVREYGEKYTNEYKSMDVEILDLFMDIADGKIDISEAECIMEGYE